MGSIPLPALDVRTQTQPPDLIGNYGRLLALRNEQQLQPLREQAMQQQLQTGQLDQQQQQLQLRQQQQSMQDQQAFQSAMGDPSNQGKTIGDLADSLAHQGAISMQGWGAMKKADVDQRTALATLDEKGLANAAAAHKQTQELYDNVMNMPDDQLAANWPTIAQQYDAIPGNAKLPLNPQQPMTKDQLRQFGPMLAMQNTYLDDALARQQKVTAAQTASAGLTAKQLENQFYAQAGGAPGVPAEIMQQADWLKKNPGKGPSDYELWKLHNTPSAMVVGNQLQGAQNSQALDFAADNYRKTGQMPPGLYRSPGTTTAIIQRAAQMDQAAGGSGLAENSAEYKANSGSLKKLQSNLDQVEAFESTANKNIDMLKEMAKKAPDLGARWANVPVRMLSAQMLGTDNMAAFKTALAPVQTEAAKILNSANLQGQLSDSSRHELQDLVDGNLPYSALTASLGVLQRDFGNRKQSMQDQISDIQQRMKGSGNAASGAPGAPAPSSPPSGFFGKFGGVAH